jgi:hypothetical protein
MIFMRFYSILIAFTLIASCNKTDTSKKKAPDVFAMESMKINGSKIETVNDLQTLFGSPDDTVHYENASNSKIEILSYDHSGLQFYVFEKDSVELYSINFEVFDGKIDHPKLILNKGVTLAKVREVFKTSYENRHTYLDEPAGNTKVLFKDGAGLGEIAMSFENDTLKSFTYNIYPNKF